VALEPGGKSPAIVDASADQEVVAEHLEEALEMIQMNPKPLALNLFTRDRSVEKRVIGEVPFGGGCINDTFSQVFNEEIPFGGKLFTMVSWVV